MSAVLIIDSCELVGSVMGVGAGYELYMIRSECMGMMSVYRVCPHHHRAAAVTTV